MDSYFPPIGIVWETHSPQPKSGTLDEAIRFAVDNDSPMDRDIGRAVAPRA